MMQAVSLASGARLGPYEIVEHVASLETGDLYTASDTRLNRTVALTVLPPSIKGTGRRSRTAPLRRAMHAA
jgi:hypothetical protein